MVVEWKMKKQNNYPQNTKNSIKYQLNVYNEGNKTENVDKENIRLVIYEG